jgi:hypothetical protein
LAREPLNLILERSFASDRERRGWIGFSECGKGLKTCSHSLLFDQPASLEQPPTAVARPRSGLKWNFLERDRRALNSDFISGTTEIN